MNELTKLTVDLTPASDAALQRATQRCGESQVAAVNRALQLYDALTEAARAVEPNVVLFDADGDRLHLCVFPRGTAFDPYEPREGRSR